MTKKVKGSKLTELEVLEDVERQTGQTPEELAAMPRLPEYATYIWLVFCQLSGTRQCGMTVNPISYTEILSWCKLHATRLKKWEVEAITAIDCAFLKSVSVDE